MCITVVCFRGLFWQLPGLPAAGLRKCGKSEKYKVYVNVSVFSTIFLFKTVGKIRILKNAQNQMKQLSLKRKLSGFERLPLHFCNLCAQVVLSQQILPRTLPPSRGWGAAQQRSSASPHHGEKGLCALEPLLRHSCDIGSQSILIFSEIHQKYFLPGFQ